MHLTQYKEDARIDETHDGSDQEDKGMTSPHEEGSRNEDDHVFVERQHPVHHDEYLFVVVVEFVGCTQRVLLAVPPQLLVHQRLQRLFVQFVPRNDRQVRTHLPLQIDQSCETQGQNTFVEHQRSDGLDTLLRPVLVLMTDVEMDEDVQHLDRNDYTNCIIAHVRM